MPTDHALLSPSSAKRWLTCTPSARVESLLPGSSSSYALEGTYAHAVAECLLQCYLEMMPLAVIDNAWAAANDFVKMRPALADLQSACGSEGFDFREIFETVHDKYVSIVWSDFVRARAEDPDAVLLIEQRVDISDFVPESFGSSDAIIIAGSTLRVYDLKYGKGVRVSAKGNPQMRLYALGAYLGPGETYTIDRVSMTIVQPRLNAGSTDEISAHDLIMWAADEVKPLADRAFHGEGDFVPGDHCEFCRAKATCRALAEYTDRIVRTSPETDALTPEDLGRVLSKLPTIETWIAGVKAKAQGILENGGSVPGWKLVEGRSVRKITDEDKARAVLQNAGFTPDDYDKVSLLGLTELIRLVGGAKTFNAVLGHLIEKQPGKPTLAPEDDPRANYSPVAGAEAAFAKEI